jgi:Ca2+-binding RTX toxin-like protein
MYKLYKILLGIEISLSFLLGILAITSNQVDGQTNSTIIIENEVAKSATPSGTLQIDVTIEGTFYDDRLMGGNGNDKIFGMGGNDILSGDAGDDLLLGNEGDDILNGEEGNDELEGGEGNDQLDGGFGRDTLEGGKGSDKYICDEEDIIINFDSTEGDSKEGNCRVKDKGLSSGYDFDENRGKLKKPEMKKETEKTKDFKGKIFPN